MPIYEFECAECGKRFDRLQKLSDPDPTDCPACSKPAVRRRVTAPSFRLAGGGWYETDFKGEKEEKRNLAGEKEPAAADGSPAGKPKDDKAEAKPAEKAEAKPGEKKPDAGAAAKPAAAEKKTRPTRVKPLQRRRSRR